MNKYLIIFGMILVALFVNQCSDRENPVDSPSANGRYWTLFFESNAIKDDVMQDFWFRNILVYTPPGYDPGDTLRPVATGIDHIVPGETLVYGDTISPDSIDIDSVRIIPPDTVFIYGDTLPGVYYSVLYLLHGFNGDHNYYKGWFDLADVMDEMISSGQIDPMIVVTPNATNNLGGGFYTNSPVMSNGRYYGGRMQDFVADEVVHIIDSVYNTIPNRAHRGISGHSMGGYGAVRLALQRNELFGSVSSMSAPLAFAGQGTSDTALFNGLWELMPMVYFENGFTPGNVSAFYNITPAPSKRLTSMMFAMAAAFSPRDPTDPDTNYAHRFSTRGFAGYIKLPFDVNGQLVSSIWDSLWMANDVTAMLLMQPGLLGVFDSTALYVDAGAEDDLGLNYHAQVFAGVAGAAVDQFEIYPGIGGGLYPADHFALISERLKKVAKFHDNAFGQ